MSAYIIGAIIAIGLYLAIAWKMNIWPLHRERVYDPDKAKLPVRFPAVFSAYTYTPQGVSCSFEDPTDIELFNRVAAPVIDMAIRNLFRGFLPEWTLAHNHSDYRIAFIKPTATNMDGSPALLISGIQSAGTVLGPFYDFYPITIVLPQQVNWEHLVYLMYSVWHEGEHFAEWENDRGWFWHFVGSGDVHPHRPIDNPELPPVPVSLLVRPQHHNCGIPEVKRLAGR